MNIVLEKERLKEMIDSLTDENALLFLKNMVDKMRLDRHIPFSKQDLIQRALESEEAIKNNRLTSLEDLEHEMKGW